VLAEVDRAPLDWFEKERTNIRAAVQHCAELGLTDICWDLAGSAHEFYTIGGYFDDWYATGSAALRACRDAGDARGEGVMLACLGQPALIASRTAGAVSGVPELRRAVDLLTGCGERHGRAIALRTLANALRRLGHLAQPLDLFQRAREDYGVSGDTVGQWQATRFIAQTHLDLGHPGEALRALRSAEQLTVEVPERGPLGRQRLLAQTWYWTGQACLADGDLDAAEAAFTAVLDGYPEPRGLGHAYATHGLGDLARHAGRFDEADRYLDVAGNLARDGADAVLVGRVLLSVAALRAAQGEGGPQTEALERAEECFAGCGAAYLQIRALAALAASERDPEAAAAAWDRVDAIYTQSGVPAEDRLHRRPRNG
jgi:tetratricopeptide (TPR) repeat protein